MANVSSAVQWACIRKSSCFLVKRPGLTMTKEPNNLRGRNSYRYNGLVHKQTVGVESAPDNKGVVLVIRNKQTNKPAKNLTKVTLKKNSRKTFKTIRKTLKGQGYRKDLQASALRKASALLKTQKNKTQSSA